MATNKTKNNITLETVERAISKSLAIGIILSSTFYIMGLIFLFLKEETIPTLELSSYSLNKFFSDLTSFKPKPFLFFGTLALILTPILRVVLSICLFIRSKEKKFVFITSIVALILIISILTGIMFSLRLG
jgi:uncharacterized membrane protein